MPAEEQTVTKNTEETTTSTSDAKASEEGLSTEALLEQERSEKILKAKELYSHGSRNFLIRAYSEAADELSDVCSLYAELYGELSDEVGMPYLLYAKSLVALAVDENKVIDVPDEDDDDEEEEGNDETEDGENKVTEKNDEQNNKKKESLKEIVADPTAVEEGEKKANETEKIKEEETQVSSSADGEKKLATSNGEANGASEKSEPINDGEKPSTSNGEAVDDDEEENEAASNLQLAWEILELAAKIFSRQGERGLPNLAEVQTELANIEFENNILEGAREDYHKALNIYKSLPNNYRRAMAEIHYKIGLTYLMQQLNQEGAESLKQACNLLAGEIDEIKSKTEKLSEKDLSNICDMEETQAEIQEKIMEIEQTQALNYAEVRAAIDSFIKPLSSGDVDAGTSKSAAATAASSSSSSSSSATIAESTKPTNISHLIKRKKPEEPTSEAETCSPAKRPTV